MERRPPSKRKRERTLAARALEHLARRDYTRFELERKLAPYTEDSAELAALLDDFTARGWLSEPRVVDAFVQAKRARFGRARIRQALLGKGVAEELVDAALERLKESELERAAAVRSKKFGAAATTRHERARQIRFLQTRGFSAEVAVRVVRGGESGDGD